MEEKALNKRKTLVCFIAAIIIPMVISLVSNTVYIFLGETAIEYNTVISSVVSTVIAVVTLLVYFFVGKFLTKDNIKTIVFMGSVYFAGELTGVLNSLVSSVTNTIMRVGTVPASTCSQIIFISSIVTTLLAVVPAFYFFNFYEENICGKESEVNVSLTKARKTVFAFVIVAAIVAAALNNGPTLLMHLLYEPVDNYNIYIAVSYISNWLSDVSFVALICLFGYMLCKRKSEIVMFGIIVCFSNRVPGVLVSVVNFCLQTALVFLEKAGNNYLYSTVLSSSYIVISVISGIFAIVVAMKVLSYFYNNKTAQVIDGESF